MTKGQLLFEVQSADISRRISPITGKRWRDEKLARTQLARQQLLFDKGAIAQKDAEVAEDAEDKPRSRRNHDGTSARAGRRQSSSERDHRNLRAGFRRDHRQRSPPRPACKTLRQLAQSVHDFRYVARLDRLRRV